MKDGNLRDAVVDVCDEFINFARVNCEYTAFLTDRYSKQSGGEEEGCLVFQAGTEAKKEAKRIKDKPYEICECWMSTAFCCKSGGHVYILEMQHYILCN